MDFKHQYMVKKSFNPPGIEECAGDEWRIKTKMDTQVSTIPQAI